MSYWDVRVQEGRTETYLLQDGKLESIKYSIPTSIGVRVLEKGSWGFASSNNPARKKFLKKKARRLSRLNTLQKQKVELQALKPVSDVHEIRSEENAFSVPKEEKKKLLARMEELAKEEDKVKSTSFSLSISQSKNVFENSEGTKITQSTPSTYLKALIVFREGNNIQRAFDNVAQLKGYEALREISAEKFIKKILEKGCRLLKAEPAPPGRTEVVVDNRLAGVFFHEAVGHACEADLHLSGSSILKGKMGEKIGGEKITLLDDKRKSSYGYYEYDSEGVKKKKVKMIEDGVLKGLLHSRETASRMSAEPTGNGRAMSPSSNPLPRMSTTVLKKGDCSKKELFEDIKKGIYLKGGSGGQVEPTKGTFIFNAEEAFLIQDGEITTPLRDVSMHGRTLNVLKNIVRIGKDVTADKRGGMCGKSGQYVPVSEFCPHLRVKEVLVGGR